MYPDIMSPYGKKSKNSSILLAVGLVLILILGISQAIAFTHANHNSVSVIGKSVSSSENLTGFPVMMVIAFAALFLLSWAAAIVTNL